MKYVVPPKVLFPDFRAFGAPQVLLSLAWMAAIAVGLWTTRARSAPGRAPEVQDPPSVVATSP